MPAEPDASFAAKYGVGLRTHRSNGVPIRWADTHPDLPLGSGVGGPPVVLFIHGWPESWFSWRHQLKAVKVRVGVQGARAPGTL